MTTTPLDWSPFEATNAIGDPGRQPEVRSASNQLAVGVPDTALDFLTADPLEVRACSSRGWSHRYQGSPRQDSYSLLVHDDLVVVAVADGVSEGAFSQVAAETAARSACKLVADQVARAGAADWTQVARRLSMRIIEEGEYRQICPAPRPDATIDERLRACLEKMATTLIVAVVDRRPTAAGLPVELCVVAGDSAAYVVRDGRLCPVGGGKPEGEPIASTRVRPLPGAVEVQTSNLHLQPGEALVLGTDGIGDPVGDGTGDVGRAYAERWATPPTIDRFLCDVNIYRRSYDDDRTAVALWVRPDVVLPPLEPAPAEPESAEPVPTEPVPTEPMPAEPPPADPTAAETPSGEAVASPADEGDGLQAPVPYALPEIGSPDPRSWQA